MLDLHGAQEKMSDSAGKVFFGKGEFQLRGVHAIAEVEIRGGRIQRIEFTSGTGNPIEGAVLIADSLQGRTVLQALEFKAQEAGSNASRDEITINIALLEAFHRAIELYLDED